MQFEIIKKRLEELGYQVSCFETAKEASDYLNTRIDEKPLDLAAP